MTWQGRNPVDDDGDGAPDTLDRGVPARAWSGSSSRATACRRASPTHEAPLLG